MGRRHWSTLPPVRGFSRVPDEQPGGRRMVRCDLCGKVIPSLGVGYHNRGGTSCTRAQEERREP